MLGDKELFNEVLQMFVRENAEADTEIQTLLNAGESALAAKCAHKLGGQGGAFGATELQQLALALEQALLMEKDDVENNLRSFQACFTRLVQSIVSDV